jgi:hypothetical protein
MTSDFQHIEKPFISATLKILSFDARKVVSDPSRFFLNLTVRPLFIDPNSGLAGPNQPVEYISAAGR